MPGRRPAGAPQSKNGTYISWKKAAFAPSARPARQRPSRTETCSCVSPGSSTLDLGIHRPGRPLRGSQPPSWSGTAPRRVFRTGESAGPMWPLRGVRSFHKPRSSAGRLQDGAPWLASSAPSPVTPWPRPRRWPAGVPPAPTRRSRPSAEASLPAAIARTCPTVAWVPECSTGSVIHEHLGGARRTVATLRAAQR